MTQWARVLQDFSENRGIEAELRLDSQTLELLGVFHRSHTFDKITL